MCEEATRPLFFVFDPDGNCVSPKGHPTLEEATDEAIDVVLFVWPDSFFEALRIGREDPNVTGVDAEIVATVYGVPAVERKRWHTRPPTRTHRILPGEKRCTKCNAVLGARTTEGPELCPSCADPE